jgi:hypothetical protein
MKFAKLMIVTLGSLSLLFLGACSGSSEANKPTNGTDKPAEATTAQVDSKAQETSKEHGHSHKEGDGSHDDGKHGMGGQIVETGDYHLEFLTNKADNGVSLNFMIGKGEAHISVADAKVTAQVQRPDGTQQALDMKYDAGEKAYKAILPKASVGEYSVAVLSEVGGKKMNSRFSFKQ